MKPKPLLVVLTGPTAVGKTALSIELAQHFQSEIINADSRQFYREMKIGTAVPSEDELKLVPHHLIQSQPVAHPISAGDFEELALPLLEELFQKHKILFLTGGSGLFIDALVHGIDQDMPKPDLELRNSLEQKSIEELQEQLKDLDPTFFAKVDQKNPHRLIRAIEVCLITGMPYSSLRRRKGKERFFETLKICIHRDREKLYHRINQRVDHMMELGLEEEARSLIEQKHLKSLQTVGYSELFQYFDGAITREECIELIKRNTRRYAKRQLTWFRRDESYQWFLPNEAEKIIHCIEDVLKKS